MKNTQVINTILLLATFIVYSCSSILSKLASQYVFLSLPYVVFFGGVVLALGVYAVLWQKVLSIMDLNKAFLCKSFTILLILLFSYLFFGEQITVNNIIGATCIVVGLIVLAWKK